MPSWDEFWEALQAILATAIEWALLILLALLVLVVGRFVLGIIRRIVVRLLNLTPARVVFDRAGLTAAMRPSDRSPAEVIATVVYAVLLIVLWIIVFEILRLSAIVELLQRLLAWIPLVVLAAAIVLVAAAIASWVSDLIRPYAEERNVQWLPAVVHAGVIVFGVLAALDVLNITFAEDLVKIVAAGAVIAFAVAFGVGGIDTARRWWARYLNPPPRKGPDGAPTAGGPLEQ